MQFSANNVRHAQTLCLRLPSSLESLLYQILRASRPAAHKEKYSQTSTQALKLKGN